MYIVIENTPSYLPDVDDPPEFQTYEDAVSYANELADELEAEGYECDRSWASRQNTYAIFCQRSDTVAPDLGRYIEVLKESQEVGLERIAELRAEIQSARNLGRDPQRQLCELADLLEDIEVLEDED